jgi:hypothetical protein
LLELKIEPELEVLSVTYTPDSQFIFAGNQRFENPSQPQVYQTILCEHGLRLPGFS